MRLLEVVLDRKKYSSKSENMWMIGLCVFSFLVHVIVLNQFKGWLCTGTDEYLLHAATLTGHDWSGVAGKTNVFGGWGYSVFLVIPFLFTDDIFVLSQIAVVMNALLCALTIPLLYSIGKRVLKEADRRIILVSALITSLFSSYFLQAAALLPEVLLFFLYILILWLLLNYVDTNKKYWAILSGLCCGYIYIVHHKMLGVVIAFVIMAVIRYIKTKDWKGSLCLLLPAAAMIALGAGVDHWLGVKESFDSANAVNTYRTAGEKLPEAFSFKGILSIVQNAVGAVWYLLTGTFLIAGFGAVSLIQKTVSGRQVRGADKGEHRQPYVFFYGFVLLAAVLMMGSSAVACHRETTAFDRAELVFYGRYFESVIGILLFFGLVWLSGIWKEKSRRKDIALLLLLEAAASVFVYYFTKGSGGSVSDYFGVSAVLFPFSYPNVTFSVIAGSVCFGTLALVFLYLFTREEDWYRRAAYVLIAGSFCFIGYNTVDNVKEAYKENASIVNFPLQNEDFSEMDKYLTYNEVSSVYVYSETGYEAFSFQIFHPDTKVIAVDSMADLWDGACEYVILPQDVAGDWAAMEPVMVTTKYVICRL